MLLTVDIGNTSTKFGIFDGQALTSRHVTATKERRIPAALVQTTNIEAIMIVSVVPEATVDICVGLEAMFDVEPTLITNYNDFGLKIAHEPLSALGTDRLVNAFASAEQFGIPTIVCSFGTATTIDAVSDKRELLGGLIAPGMVMMLDALHTKTARLPAAGVEFRMTTGVLGTTTQAAMLSGTLYSQIGLVEIAVGKIKAEIGNDAKVIATGGWASLISENTDVIDIIDENLLLEGLRLLRNRLHPA